VGIPVRKSGTRTKKGGSRLFFLRVIFYEEKTYRTRKKKNPASEYKDGQGNKLKLKKKNGGRVEIPEIEKVGINRKRRLDSVKEKKFTGKKGK